MVKKIFRKLTFIETVSMFSTMLALFVDTSLTGIFLDKTALSAAAICTPVLLLLATLGGTLSVGAKVLCSKAIGENNAEQNNSVFSSVMSAALFISVPLTVIVEVFAPQLTVILGVETGTAQFVEACNYLRGYCIGTPFFTVLLCLTGFVIMSEKSNYVLYSNIALLIADIVFDLINVYIFKQGMLGMGIASSISHIAAMAVVLIPFFNKSFPFFYRISAARPSVVLEAFKQGVNYAVRHLSKSTKAFIINRLLIASGVPNGLSVYALISSYANIFTTVGSAMGKTTLSLSKVYATAKDKVRLKRLFDRGMADSFILNAVSVAVILLVPKLVLRISLQPDSDIFDETATALMIFIGSIIIYSINRCIFNFYQGLGKLKLSFFFSMAHNFLGPIFALALVVILQMSNIWWFYMIQEFLVLGCIAVYVVITQRPFEKNCNPFMLLNRVEDCTDIIVPVNNSENISGTCEKIIEFMEQNGAEVMQRQNGNEFLRHYLSLAAAGGKKPAHTEVRALKKGSGFCLVIENDGFEKAENPFKNAVPLTLNTYKEKITVDRALSINRVIFEI